MENNQSKNYRILIVDDICDWLNHHAGLIKTFYGLDTLEIVCASSAQSALEKIMASEQPFDLLLTDLEMESIANENYAGAWLVKNMKVHQDKVKNILIISGSYDIKEVADSLNVDFIPKDLLMNNPLLLKYKLDELLKI